jgi:hypothetical protein
MAGRIKNLVRDRGNFNPTKLGTPSILPPSVKKLMAQGIPQRKAVSIARKGGDNFKPTSSNWMQPGKS